MQLLVSRLVILLMFAVLIARLYQLQLVSAESDRYRYTTDVRTTRYVPLRPIRGEILASDGRTKLAETMPIYQVSLRPADLPTDPAERDRVFASVSDLLGLSNTLVISPTSALTGDSALVSDLRQGLGLESARIARDSGGDVFTMTVPEGLTGAAVRLSDVYSHTIGLENPIEGLVARSDVPGYRPLLVESNVPREVALVIRENAASLPGVLIEQDYERRYPLSPHIQSLSQVLGYIGRVSQCELVRQNPARSWITGLLDSIGNAVECGIVRKQVNPFQLGMPRYLDDDRIGKDGIEASFEDELRGQLRRCCRRPATATAWCSRSMPRCSTRPRRSCATGSPRASAAVRSCPIRWRTSVSTARSSAAWRSSAKFGRAAFWRWSACRATTTTSGARGGITSWPPCSIRQIPKRRKKSAAPLR